MCSALTLENTNTSLVLSPYETNVPVSCDVGFSVRDPQVTTFNAVCGANGKWTGAWSCESEFKS